MSELLPRLEQFAFVDDVVAIKDRSGLLAKWDEQRNAVTCTGLCQFITDAEPAAESLTLHVNSRRQARRKAASR